MQVPTSNHYNEVPPLTGNMPSHRQQKRPVSILKSKKGSEMASRFIRNAHQWGQRFYDQDEGGIEEEDGQRNSRPDKTITQANFFECREVTNCEFIYE
jgi:hypothetical protein